MKFSIFENVLFLPLVLLLLMIRISPVLACSVCVGGLREAETVNYGILTLLIILLFILGGFAAFFFYLWKKSKNFPNDPSGYNQYRN